MSVRQKASWGPGSVAPRTSTLPADQKTVAATAAITGRSRRFAALNAGSRSVQPIPQEPDHLLQGAGGGVVGVVGVEILGEHAVGAPADPPRVPG